MFRQDVGRRTETGEVHLAIGKVFQSFLISPGDLNVDGDLFAEPVGKGRLKGLEDGPELANDRYRLVGDVDAEIQNLIGPRGGCGHDRGHDQGRGNCE